MTTRDALLLCESFGEPFDGKGTQSISGATVSRRWIFCDENLHRVMVAISKFQIGLQI
jgi:hypothetical protein